MRLSDLLVRGRLSETLVDIYVALFPLVALMGNGAADAWLSVMVVAFLLRSLFTNSWAWLRQPWLVMALVFWGWAMFCSSISQWPSDSFNDSSVWFRFPVFAAVLAELLTANRARARLLLYSMVACVTFMVCYIVWTRAGDMEIDRLPGPFGTQNPGWYLWGFGLPLALGLLALAKTPWNRTVLCVALACGLLAGMFLTGQIYMSLSFTLGIVVFVALSRSPVLISLTLLSVAAAGGVLYLALDGPILERLSSAALTRLPWKETSDYYNYWVGGFHAGLHNLAVGVGPNNYNVYCPFMFEQGLGDMFPFTDLSPRDGCNAHPHQRYLQVFAETGVPGLLLFVTMALVLLTQAVKAWRNASAGSGMAAVALTLLIVNFWPVSNYSEAFGQFMNTYYWFSLGLAVALLKGIPGAEAEAEASSA